MNWMNKCGTDNGAGHVLGGAAPAARILHVRMRFSPSVLPTSELNVMRVADSTTALHVRMRLSHYDTIGKG